VNRPEGETSPMAVMSTSPFATPRHQRPGTHGSSG
jgi:hypothetical protein